MLNYYATLSEAKVVKCNTPPSLNTSEPMDNTRISAFYYSLHPGLLTTKVKKPEANVSGNNMYWFFYSYQFGQNEGLTVVPPITVQSTHPFDNQMGTGPLGPALITAGYADTGIEIKPPFSWVSRQGFDIV